MILVWLGIVFRFLKWLIAPQELESKIDFTCPCPACGHKDKKSQEFMRADIAKEGERAVIKMACATCAFEWFIPVVGQAKWPAK